MATLGVRFSLDEFGVCFIYVEILLNSSGCSDHVKNPLQSPEDSAITQAARVFPATAGIGPHILCLWNFLSLPKLHPTGPGGERLRQISRPLMLLPNLRAPACQYLLRNWTVPCNSSLWAWAPPTSLAVWSLIMPKLPGSLSLYKYLGLMLNQINIFGTALRTIFKHYPQVDGGLQPSCQETAVLLLPCLPAALHRPFRECQLWAWRDPCPWHSLCRLSTVFSSALRFLVSFPHTLPWLSSTPLLLPAFLPSS